MRHLLLISLIAMSGCMLCAQDRHYSSVNPVLFSYTTKDVFINSPIKYNNGKQLWSPDPVKYPWEERLENGMPNVLIDPQGNISVYFSSFISFSPTPPSKVGAVVYVNTSSDLSTWRRPDTGLYWYNPNGKTSDEKISSTFQTGFLKTNIVAVDIESLGIFDDGGNSSPIKLIYMPQREFQYKYLGVYEMERSFTADGVLTGFNDMKSNRLANQKILTFKHINADSHMNWMKHKDDYYFTSRVNSRRSALKPDEIPPFTKDPRKRYRRSTITNMGKTFENKKVDFNVVLDYSTKEWEPYGMQPFRLPGFEKDIWMGLVTMYGVEGYPNIENKQRTELAISNNGEDWYYVKPGVAFLDNGTDPSADDFGCINIATPVYKTRFHSGRNENDPFFFYASSNIRHVEGRNPGISLATGKYGKLVGLKVGDEEKTFYSVSPITVPDLSVSSMPKLSVANAFAIDAEFYPYILGDITDDPAGVSITELNSYAGVRMYVYDENKVHGEGTFLGGTLGSSIPGTHDISDEYIAVDFTTDGTNGINKSGILNYLRKCSAADPQKIISFKDFPDIPVIFKTQIRNATFYGVKFTQALNNTTAINIDAANDFKPSGVWSTNMLPNECKIIDFYNRRHSPNEVIPTNMESGSIALKVVAEQSAEDQTICKMLGDNLNYISVDYLKTGAFRYNMVKEGTDYLNMQILPPDGKSFVGKSVILTIEAVKNNDRKYDQNFKEETTVMRVSCPDLDFEKIIHQDIIWNFRRDVPTPVDSSYARGFAYLPFSAFVGDMNTIIVGGGSSSCANRFTGTIQKIEISKSLPKGDSDFWNSDALKVAVNEKKRKNDKLIAYRKEKVCGEIKCR